MYQTRSIVRIITISNKTTIECSYDNDSLIKNNNESHLRDVMLNIPQSLNKSIVSMNIEDENDYHLKKI